MPPKAEGGAGVVHADAKLTAREAIEGLPDGLIKTSRSRPRPRARCFSPAPRSERKARRVIGAPRTSVESSRANRDADMASIPRPACALLAAPRRRGCRRSTPSPPISAISSCCGARPRRVTASPARWRSIRRRCRSSTRCSPRPPMQQQYPRRDRGVRAQSGSGHGFIDGVMYDRLHRACKAIAGAGKGGRRFMTPAIFCRTPPSDRTACRRREIRGSPRRPDRGAPRDRSRSGGQCGRRQLPTAQP